MGEQRSANFMRLLSDESTVSSLSVDSCDYHQMEIFDQLPSIQASRPQQNTQGGPDPGGEVSPDHLSKTNKDKNSIKPLRDLVMCIQGKRDARDRRKMQINNISFWESWRRSQSISRKRVWGQMGGALLSLLPWRHTLHAIEGRSGIGVKAYFVFLRYLICLNLLHCALICGFIVGPTIFYGRSSALVKFGGNDSVLDFFLGTGYLDRSPVFFGFYTRGSLDMPCLNTPLLYLVGIITILFLSLIMVVRRTVVGYKHTWMLGKRYSVNVSFKLFCGWDFTIQDPDAAAFKHNFIRHGLKLFLEEQSFSLRVAQRTLKERVQLYLIRLILNVIVLGLLTGAFSLIYIATTVSQQESEHHWLISLLLQYFPPITITFINLLFPHVFRKIASFEDYSYTMQVNATLVRSIFLKLASLGIYLFFIITSTQGQLCRENRFGREMYKLTVFNFLATFCYTFLLNYPRKLVQEKYPRSLLAQRLGKQQFLIPFNVLDLVYGQTVSWVGVYYCPLLPLIGIVILFFTFYIKKFTVLRCCVAERRMFRASNSSVLFHFMLLLGLLMAAVTLGFNLYQQDILSTCGPLGNGENVFNVTGACVGKLPNLAQSTLHYLASEAFAVALILAEIIILTSYVSRRRANQKAIERLKDMLVMSSSDKRFLVKQHATMLRRRKTTRRVRPATTGEDAPNSKDPLHLIETN